MEKNTEKISSRMKQIHKTQKSQPGRTSNERIFQCSGQVIDIGFCMDGSKIKRDLLFCLTKESGMHVLRSIKMDSFQLGVDLGVINHDQLIETRILSGDSTIGRGRVEKERPFIEEGEHIAVFVDLKKKNWFVVRSCGIIFTCAKKMYQFRLTDKTIVSACIKGVSIHFILNNGWKLVLKSDNTIKTPATDQHLLRMNNSQNRLTFYYIVVEENHVVLNYKNLKSGLKTTLQLTSYNAENDYTISQTQDTIIFTSSSESETTLIEMDKSSGKAISEENSARVQLTGEFSFVS